MSESCHVFIDENESTERREEVANTVKEVLKEKATGTLRIKFARKKELMFSGVGETAIVQEMRGTLNVRMFCEDVKRALCYCLKACCTT